MFSELCFCVGSTRVSDEFCMLQAPYRVTGFIWHGHEHYVAYLLSGRRWHCLDDAVVSEVDVAALPSQACMVFLQKAVRLSQKVAGAGPRAAGRVPHPIWMQLPEVLAQAAMLPACRLGSFAKRVARKRAIRNGEQRSSSRQQQRSGKQGSGRPQKQRSGRPQKQRSGRPRRQRSAAAEAEVWPAAEAEVWPAAEAEVWPAAEAEVWPAEAGVAEAQFWPAAEPEVRSEVWPAAEAEVWPAAEAEIWPT